MVFMIGINNIWYLSTVLVLYFIIIHGSLAVLVVNVGAQTQSVPVPLFLHPLYH